jgi:Predicted membrane protein
MVFIDELALELFFVAFIGFLLDYTVLSIFKDYKARNKNKLNSKLSIESHLQGSIFMFTAMSIFVLVMGFYGEMSWNLPGPYNLLFYDPFIMFGILILGFALSVKYNQKLQYVGLVALFMGLVLIEYGISGYNLGYTSSPIALLGLYTAFGIAGIFAYPTTLVMDKYRENPSNKPLNKSWILCIVIFLIFLTLGSILAAFIGGAAVPAHLAVPP